MFLLSLAVKDFYGGRVASPTPQPIQEASDIVRPVPRALDAQPTPHGGGGWTLFGPPNNLFLFFHIFNFKNLTNFSDYCFIAGFTGLMVRVGKELQLRLLDNYVVAGPNFLF